MMIRRYHRGMMIASACCIFPASAAQGQDSRDLASDRTVTIVPGPQYDASGIKEKLLGEGWREVWLTPIRVPVFDIDKYAGGLNVGEKGGGRQTRTLHFTEKKDTVREYLFRSVDKFPVGQTMPAAIRGTTLGDIIQDQVSALFPASGLMVPPFLEAIGALHVTPKLYVMPDDPRLGKYREEFAGLLGTVELSPQEDEHDEPGFAGSRKIKSADKFLEDIEASKVHRLDERELFAVRLIDLLINDNDRTTDNMRFARYGDEKAYTWRPLPRDRDRALSDARGWIIDYVVRPVYAKLIAFEPTYDLEGLTFESYNVDRRLLQRITRKDASEIAIRVRNAITNDVIERGISRLPTEWRSRPDVVNRLRTNLRARRDLLPQVADDFYSWLASEVDIHGTDEKDRAVIERLADGRVKVTIRGTDESNSATPFFERTFLPDETNEVRIFLHANDDVAVIRGARNNDITVRLIGGKGDDVLADSAGGGAARFYDDKGKNRFITASGTRVSEKEWMVPRQGGGIRFDAPWRPDWGASNGWGPAFDYVDGGGLVVGYGPRYQAFGFRRLPYKWKAGANALIGTGNFSPGVNAFADYRFENSPMAFMFDGRATKYEAFRFYGFGNDAPDVPVRLARVDHDVIAIEPRIVRQIGWRSRENLDTAFASNAKPDKKLRPTVGKMWAGPVFFWSRPHPENGSPFEIENLGDVARAGARAGFDLDRTSGGAPSDRGWTLRGQLDGYPGILDLPEFFGKATGAAATYVPLGGAGTHAAFRVGGSAATSATPVQDAVAIGGRSTVRGFSSQRFIGDRSAFGSAEIRVPVGTVPFLVKWKTGAFGLVDAGRVWLDGESPGGWHTGVGGGLWFSSLGQTLSVAYANGEGHHFYLQKGMSF